MKTILICALLAVLSPACRSFSSAIPDSAKTCADPAIKSAEGQALAAVEKGLAANDWKGALATVEAEAKEDGELVVRCAVEEALARTVSKSTGAMTAAELNEREARRDHAIAWLSEHQKR